MKFIEVTDSNNNRRLINLDNVTDIGFDVSPKRLRIYFMDKSFIVSERETYDEIKGLIRQAQAEQEGRV